MEGSLEGSRGGRAVVYDDDHWSRGYTTIRDATGDWVDPAKARVTVAEWSQVWLPTKAHLRPRTREKYESALRVWVLPRWGRVALADVTHADLVRWVSEIQVGAARRTRATRSS